jgi:hypothetical protein
VAELLVKFAVPLYVAVILSDPFGNFEVVMLAIPPTSVLVPSPVDPFLNVTVPVGVPPYWADTVAVNVTD